MTSEDVIAVIDQLCDKLGLAISSMSELVPELVRMKIAENIFAIAVCVILMVPASVFMYTQFKAALNWALEQHNSGWKSAGLTDYALWNVAWVIGGIVDVGGVIFLIISAYDLVRWCVSPTVVAIEYILSLM